MKLELTREELRAVVFACSRFQTNTSLWRRIVLETVLSKCRDLGVAAPKKKPHLCRGCGKVERHMYCGSCHAARHP